MLDIQILPSILAADQNILEEECIKAEVSGGNQIHIDVMDGIFVLDKNFTPEIVKLSKSVTSIPQNVHLMVQQPEKYIQPYIEAGSSTIHIHIESDGNISDLISRIHNSGSQAGIAINPETAIEQAQYYIDRKNINNILIMTVKPGMGGQKYISNMNSKIMFIRKNYPEINITVDGGIDNNSIKSAAEHGANIFVSGSYLYDLNDMQNGISNLKSTAKKHFNKKLFS